MIFIIIFNLNLGLRFVRILRILKNRVTENYKIRPIANISRLKYLKNNVKIIRTKINKNLKMYMMIKKIINLIISCNGI